MDKEFGREIVLRFRAPLRRLYTLDELWLPPPIDDALARLKNMEQGIERDPLGSDQPPGATRAAVAGMAEPCRQRRVLWRWGRH